MLIVVVNCIGGGTDIKVVLVAWVHENAIGTGGSGLGGGVIRYERNSQALNSVMTRSNF